MYLSKKLLILSSALLGLLMVAVMAQCLVWLINHKGGFEVDYSFLVVYDISVFKVRFRHKGSVILKFNVEIDC